MAPKRFVSHWFDGNLGRWPARYAPTGLTIGALVGILGFVLSANTLLRVFNDFSQWISVPVGFVLVLFWGFAAFVTANLPRYLRHKTKPTWIFDPSSDEVIISSAKDGTMVLRFSEFERFFINEGTITGEAMPINTYVVYGRLNERDVVLGWFVNEGDAIRLKERLLQLKANNNAAYEWSRSRTSNG